MGKVLVVTDIKKRMEIYRGEDEMGLAVYTDNCNVEVKYEDLISMRVATVDIRRRYGDREARLVLSYFNEESDRIRKGLLKVMRKWGLSS